MADRPGATSGDEEHHTGVGVSFITFGDAMVWAADSVDGKVSRIDPHTNKVTAKVPIGAPQAIAAGDGSVWVSVAGAPRNGTLPASSCEGVVSGGRTPDVLIASDNPLHGPLSDGPRAMTDAIRLVLEQHDFRAGKYAVGYQSCDASTAQSDTFEFRKCAANANAYARAKRLVAVIGPYNSQCATVEMPILNRAPGGPLAEISPSNSYPGLTRPVSLPAKWGGSRNEPKTYYPTGVRHYVRLAANDDYEGVADAILAKQLGVSSAYLLDDGQGAQNVWLTNPFRRTARRLDITIAGAQRFDPAAKSYDALAERIARSGAQGVVIGGDVTQGRRQAAQSLTRPPRAADPDHDRRIGVHAGLRRAQARRAGRARAVREHGEHPRGSTRPESRRAAVPARSRHPAAPAMGARGGTGRRARAARDRALGRDASVSAQRAPGGSGQERPPRQLPLQSQR